MSDVEIPSKRAVSCVGQPKQPSLLASAGAGRAQERGDKRVDYDSRNHHTEKWRTVKLYERNSEGDVKPSKKSDIHTGPIKDSKLKLHFLPVHILCNTLSLRKGRDSPIAFVSTP